MSGPSWIMDYRRIATKIKSASGSCDLTATKYLSNPTRTCPRCSHVIDNSDVMQAWPGLPRGVKFDPTDPELLWHLLAKEGIGDAKPHSFINEFIPTLEGTDGICYTHPEKLPGVKLDGSFCHFFHRTFMAYSTGTRKRRKINNDDTGDVRWHKTGKTKPVVIDGKQQGCKKIMVLYVGKGKGGKPVKTNWVMHQYHLGIEEDERDGEYVVSKLFYQQQGKQNDINKLEPIPETSNINEEKSDVVSGLKLKTPEPPLQKRHILDPDQTPAKPTLDDDLSHDIEFEDNNNIEEKHNEEPDNQHKPDEVLDEKSNLDEELDKKDKLDDNEGHSENQKSWEGDSQFLLDSQQLAEGIALCEEFLLSQNSCGEVEVDKNKPRLSDYARLGAEYLKKDLEECQKLVIDNPDILGTPPDIRLSQLEFSSQDFSGMGW